jgi:hypothetical protein
MPKSVPIALPQMEPIFQDTSACRSEFSALSPQEQSVICGVVSQTDEILNNLVEAINNYGVSLVFQRKALEKQVQELQDAANLQAATGDVNPALQLQIEQLQEQLTAKDNELATLQAKLENYTKLPGVMNRYNDYFQRLIEAIKSAQATQPSSKPFVMGDNMEDVRFTAPPVQATTRRDNLRRDPLGNVKINVEEPKVAPPIFTQPRRDTKPVTEQIRELQDQIADKQQQMGSGDQFANQRLEREIQELQARIKALVPGQRQASVPSVAVETQKRKLEPLRFEEKMKRREVPGRTWRAAPFADYGLSENVEE